MSPIFPGLRGGKRKAADGLEGARAALDAGDLEAAERLLDAHLQGAGGDAAAAALKGEALNRRGRWQEAAALLASVLKRAPDHAGTRRELACAYLAGAQLRPALEVLSPLLIGAAANMDVQRLLEVALKTLASRAQQEEAWVWLELGGALLGLGESRMAELCERAAHGTTPVGEARTLQIADLEAYCRKGGHALRRFPHVKVEPPVGTPQVAAMPPLESFACALRSGIVLGHAFVPASADGRVFLERCIHNPVKLLHPSAAPGLDTVRLGSSGRLLARPQGVDDYPGRHVLIGNHDNVGHWFYNHFARLRLVEEIPELAGAKLVVGDHIRPMQMQSLARAGYGEDRITKIPRGRFARFEELWVPSLLFGGTLPAMCWHPGIARWIRARLGLTFDAAPARRLFIGRAQARWRRLLNEAQIVDALAEFGFESVDPGALSLDEQIALAASAQVIVAAFGAGINLHLFAPEGTPVVELKFDTRNQMDIHPTLTEEIGQPHHAVYGEAQHSAADLLNADFSVPVDAVRDAVRRALQETG